MHQSTLASDMYNLKDYPFWKWVHQVNVLCKQSYTIIEQVYPEIFKSTQLMTGRQNGIHIGRMLYEYVSVINNLCEVANYSHSEFFDEHSNYKTVVVNKDTIFLCTNNIYDIYSHKGYIEFMDNIFPNKLPSEII